MVDFRPDQGAVVTQVDEFAPMPSPHAAKELFRSLAERQHV